MPDPAPSLADETLRAVVRLLDDAFAADRGWDPQPTLLVHLARRPDGDLDLGLRDVDGHPADVLLGCVAPDAWDALGVSQLGWARNVRGRQERRRVRLTALVSRTAGEIALVRHDGEPEAVEVAAPSEGRVPDVIRRCLDLPTPPPADVPVAAHGLAQWLHAIEVGAAQTSSPLSWRALCELHPADLGRDPDVDTAIAATRNLVRGTTWEQLRWATIEGRADVRCVAPSLAGWFDTGSFARWVCPDVADLEGLAPMLAADATRALARTAAELLRPRRAGPASTRSSR